MEENVNDGQSPPCSGNEHKLWDLEDVPYADYEFPWGKHKGVQFCDVPPSYIVWVLAQEFMLEPKREYLRKKLVTFASSPAFMEALLIILNRAIRRSGQPELPLQGAQPLRVPKPVQEPDQCRLGDGEIEDNVPF